MVDNQATKPQELVKQGVAVAAVRSVTPRQDSNNSEPSEGIVIKGLGSDDYIKESYLLMLGWVENPLTRQWEKVRDPVMNAKGIGNFIKCLHTLKRIDFSNFDEKQVANFTFKFFKDNLSQFLVYAREFELKQEDYNVVKTELFFMPLAAFSNAKGAGHRNVVRGTLSENVFMKALSGQGGDDGKGKKGILGWLTSPFKKGN